LTSVYVTTSTKSGTVRNLSFGREDILRYDINTDTWLLYFDGSHVGLSSAQINGFHLMADGSILLTFKFATAVPGVGSVDTMDIVRFIPASLGENNTTGVFELYFKGANVGLGPSSEATGERINAIGFLLDGRLLVSTSGLFSVPGVSGADEDLIAFTATSLGETTSGSWQLYFAGSKVGLSDGGNDEDVEGTSIDNDGNIYLTTNGNFSVPGASGDGADIFRCIPPQSTSLPITSCTYDLVWSGSAHGLAGHSVNGIHLEHGTAGNSAPTVTISAPANNAIFAAGEAVTFTGIAVDSEDGNLTGSLAWSSSLDGALGTGGSVVTSSLSVGTHLITAAVSDSGGLSSSNAINVTITTSSANTAPSVAIDSPANESTFTAGESVTFTGIAVDSEDGDLTGSLAWSSSLDGALGNGGSVVTSSLSVGTHLITAAVSDSGGLSGSNAISVTINPTSSPSPLLGVYVTTGTNNAIVRGISFGREDILRYDINTDTWSLYFDGSHAGLSSAQINGFHLMADGSILLTFKFATAVPGVGSVDTMDIVRFIPASLGENNTTGVFELYFKGANVGLGPSSEASGERINAISFLPDGRLLVSTSGLFSVPGVSGADEDLIAFAATSLGETTSGSWQLYFDGSRVGLSDGGDNEDVEGVSVGSNGNIYLTTNGNFSVPGVSGDGTDIFRCQLQSTGSNTSCTYDIFWRGSEHGLAGLSINGTHLVFGQ